jgi:hypothetical protein
VNVASIKEHALIIRQSSTPELALKRWIDKVAEIADVQDRIKCKNSKKII